MATKKKAAPKTEVETPPQLPARPDFIPPKEEKEAPATAKASELAKEFRKLIDDKEEVGEQLKTINKRIEVVSKELAEEMETLGVDSFKVKDVGSISVGIINHPSITDKDAFIVWLDEHNMADMAPRSVHYKRLESLVKELLGNNEELPSSLTNFQQKRAALRRS